MDLKSTLRNAGVAAAACAFAGMAAAAVVPIEQSLDLHLPQGSLVYNIATEGAPPDNTVSF